MCVIAVGDPFSKKGVVFYGPFVTEAEAAQFANDRGYWSESSWFIVLVESPHKMPKGKG